MVHGPQEGGECRVLRSVVGGCLLGAVYTVHDVTVRGKRLRSVKDGPVASAPADVAVKSRLHVGHGELRILLEARVESHDHARRAVAALATIEASNSLVDGVEAAGAAAEALGGGDAVAMH